jgi:hypothetical protein
MNPMSHSVLFGMFESLKKICPQAVKDNEFEFVLKDNEG